MVRGENVVFDHFAIKRERFAEPAALAGRVSFSLRPQSIHLHRGLPSVPLESCVLPGRVVQRAYLGEHWDYAIRPKHGEIQLRVTARPHEVFERIVQGWRRMDRKAKAREAKHQHASRALHVSTDEDGTVVLRGRLAPEVGALLLRALDAARETLYQQTRVQQAATPTVDPALDRPTKAQQQADALAPLAETALHHGIDPGAPGERYQVVVHVDAPVLADPEQPGQSVLEGGVHVPAETSQRLACDASRVVMRQDQDGRLVEIGARTRTIPPALRRALHHRDQTCRFPGCTVAFGQGHHLHHWAQGGPTTLSNLALLCRRHHRAVHEEGYQVNRQPDGTLRFRRPDGRPLPHVPRPPAVPADPVQTLREQHDAQGLRLNARTTCPGWLGECLDVGWAIGVLHPLATRGVGSSGRGSPSTE